VSAECADWVDSIGSHLGDAYRQVTRVDATQADRAVEALMNRAWEKRDTRALTAACCCPDNPQLINAAVLCSANSAAT
jgi:hypothetical protein